MASMWEIGVRGDVVTRAAHEMGEVDRHSSRIKDEPFDGGHGWPLRTAKPRASRPELFIASSVEGLKAARALQSELEHDLRPTPWSQGTFDPSSFALEALVGVAQRVDFAAFMFTPDDVATIRGKSTNVARDNVLFELGLFIGALERSRCFIVQPRGDSVELRLPSDLAGITTLTNDGTRTDNLRAAMGPAATSVIEAVRKHGSKAIIEDRRPLPPVTQPYDDDDATSLLENYVAARRSGIN